VNYAEFGGGTLKTVPFTISEKGEWMYDLELFEKAITPKTKVVMLTNPHNPAGKIFTKQELERVTEILEKHPDIIVVSDDVYFFLPFDDREYHTFAEIGNNWHKTLTVFSAGKVMNCTGWKVGWICGPEELVVGARRVHEAAVFNNNVPGQVAIANSLDACFSPYKGFKNYPAFVAKTFQDARDEAVALVEKTKMPWVPSQCQSGYFLPLDVSKTRSLIPKKYFQPGRYEDDPESVVIRREFQGEVPIDYAFCRWMAIEKGLAFLPISAFCSIESKHKIENFARMAICKTPDFFREGDLVKRFMKAVE